MKKLFLLCSLFLGALMLGASEIKLDFDGRASDVSFRSIKVGRGLNYQYATWIADANKKQQYLIVGGSGVPGEAWSDYTLSFVPDKTGTVAFKVRGKYNDDKTNYYMVAYDDFKATGTAIANPSFETVVNGRLAGWNDGAPLCIKLNAADAAEGKNYLWSSHDLFIQTTLSVKAGVPVTITFKAKKAGVVSRKEFRPYPAAAAAPAPVVKKAPEAEFRAGIKIDFDGRAAGISLRDPVKTKETKVLYAHWIKDAAQKSQYLIVEAYRAPGKEWKKYETGFTPDRDGTVMMQVRGGWSEDRTRYYFAAYDDFKVDGAELANPSFEMMGGKRPAYWEGGAPCCWKLGVSDAADGKNYALSSHDLSFTIPLKVKANVPVRLSFMAKDGGSVPRAIGSAAPSYALKNFDAKAPSKIRIEIDARQDNTRISDVQCGKGLTARSAPWAKEESASYLLIEGTDELTDQWQEFEFSFVPGNNTVIWFILRGLPESKSSDFWVLYDNIRGTGTDNLPNGSFEAGWGRWQGGKWNLRFNQKDAAQGKNYGAASYNRVMKEHFDVFAGRRITIKFKAKKGGSSDRIPGGSGLDERARSYFRVYNSKVKYLPLEDKGIAGDEITPIATPLKQSERRYPEFADPHSDRPARPGVTRADFELLEEDHAARTAAVRFGLPLPEKGIYDLKNLRVLDPAGKEVNAQKSAVAWWPDRSIKMALLQFAAPLGAGERAVWHAEWGAGVTAKAYDGAKVDYSDDGKLITVSTGALKAKIDKEHFNLLSAVTVDGRPVGSFDAAGLRVTGEHGEKFTSSAQPPYRFAVEEPGPRRVVFRFDGKLSDGKRTIGDYTARIGFTADSPKVDFTVTCFNTNLDHEFTDVTDYGVRFLCAGDNGKLTMENVSAGRFCQYNDQVLKINGREQPAGSRLSGVGKVNFSDGSAIGFTLRDAWQRWPKAFSFHQNQLDFELLPVQPEADFGKELPYYLNFNLAGGKYRSKWGMSFTEEFSIDFSGKSGTEILGARQIIPVIDRDHLFAAKVFEGTLPKNNHRFDRFDGVALEGFYRHMEVKKQQREYGYLNYGDWFGERGRNWTNNEYDMANGLFLLFLRTGNRDVCRWALTAARHQADVDIIHAYPDKYYVGCNAQHGIGHTGVNYQVINPATWSYKLDHSFWGINGHTWSEGMLDAWMFTGDAVTMDSALLLGRHLVDFTAPGFVSLGSHERSAGWSVRAILAYYRTTGDKRYLDAASRIVQLALDEQKFNRGGAWPHILPGDHSGGYKGAFGNCPYLMGIISEMIRQYNRIVPTEANRRSLIAVGNWLKRTHSRAGMGWPYAASWDAKPYHQPASECSLLILPGLVAGGRFANDRDNLEIAANIVSFAILDSLHGGIGKQLSMNLCYNAGTIEEMGAFDRQLGGVLPEVIDEKAAVRLLGSYETSLRIRGPVEKEFKIVLTADKAKFKLIRNLHGSRPDREPQYTVCLIDPAGREMEKFQGSTYNSFERELEISGKAGDQFRLLIHDNMSGNWNIPSGDGFNAFGTVLPNYTFGVGHISRLYVTIPAGTEKFSMRFTPIHAYDYRIIVSDDTGKVQWSKCGTSFGGPRLPWMKFEPKDPSFSAEFTVAPSDKAQNWQILCVAPFDMGIALTGIPPVVSTVPAIYPEERAAR